VTGISGVPYRWYVAAQCVSLVGTTMTLAGLYWLAVQVTHGNGLFLSTVVALQFLPVLLFSRRTGVLVSRFRPARLLMITQSLLLAGSLGYAIPLFAGWMAPWYLCLLTFTLGFVTTVDVPARQMFMLDLVGGDQLRRGMSLYGTFTGLAKIIGPSLAGVIIAVKGEGAVFAADSASFLFVIFVLVRFAGDIGHRAETSPGRTPRRFRWVLDLPVRIQLIAGLALLFGGFGYQFEVTNPLMATEVFHLGSAGYGIMGTCIAIGGILGNFYSSRRPDPGIPEILAWTSLFGLAEAAAAIMGSPWGYDLFMLLIGIATSLFASSSTVYIQRTAPEESRGNSLAAYNAGFMGFVPAGAFVVAAIASSAGVRWALIGPGLAMIAFTALAAQLLSGKSGQAKAVNDVRRQKRQRRREREQPAVPGAQVNQASGYRRPDDLGHGIRDVHDP
jgi:MFS family permease